MSEWSAEEYQKARRVSFESTFKDSASRAAARICSRRRIISTVAVMMRAIRTNTITAVSQSMVVCFGGCACEDAERIGSGDGERKTLLARQIAFEPLPASVLFALV